MSFTFSETSNDTVNKVDAYEYTLMQVKAQMCNLKCRVLIYVRLSNVQYIRFFTLSS